MRRHPELMRRCRLGGTTVRPSPNAASVGPDRLLPSGPILRVERSRKLFSIFWSRAGTWPQSKGRRTDISRLVVQVPIWPCECRMTPNVCSTHLHFHRVTMLRANLHRLAMPGPRSGCPSFMGNGPRLLSGSNQ
jgi:hypothetical protein